MSKARQLEPISPFFLFVCFRRQSRPHFLHCMPCSTARRPRESAVLQSSSDLRLSVFRFANRVQPSRADASRLCPAFASRHLLASAPTRQHLRLSCSTLLHVLLHFLSFLLSLFAPVPAVRFPTSHYHIWRKSPKMDNRKLQKLTCLCRRMSTCPATWATPSL